MLGVLSRALLACVVALGLITTTASQTNAQPSVPSQATDEYQRALQEMLADPSDLNKTLRYAQLAAERDNIEGAISALSQLLITNPELWQVHYQLGVLYYRLKSYALAKSYFEEAASKNDVPSATRTRIADYIAQIEKQTAANRWSGQVTVGGQYQSNVNAASGVVPAQAQTAVVENLFSTKEDFGVFGFVQATHIYDFNTVDGTTWESNFQGYGAKQISEEDFDLVFIELTSGPRFVLPTDLMTGLSVRPYLEVDYVRLGDSRLDYAKGGGFDVRREFSDTAYLSAGYNVQDLEYRNTALRPRLTDLDGVQHQAKLQFAFALLNNVLLNIEERAISLNAHQPFERNLALASMVTLAIAYDAPFGVTSNRWVSSASAEYEAARYEAPDPSIDAANTRVDDRWYFRLATSVPVAAEWSIIGAFSYRNNGSNLRSFTYDNKEATLAISYKF
jgi:tetratricopeptide (TPR) repeat protein